MIPVLPAHVHMVWPKVQSYLAGAMREGMGEFYSLADVKRHLCDGAWSLWAVEHGAIVTSIKDYPKARVLEILLCGGDRLPEWFGEMRTSIEAYARTRGAGLLWCTGRAGWGRLCGAREIGRTFVKELP